MDDEEQEEARKRSVTKNGEKEKRGSLAATWTRESTPLRCAEGAYPARMKSRRASLRWGTRGGKTRFHWNSALLHQGASLGWGKGLVRA